MAVPTLPPKGATATLAAARPTPPDAPSGPGLMGPPQLEAHSQLLRALWLLAEFRPPTLSLSRPSILVGVMTTAQASCRRGTSRLWWIALTVLLLIMMEERTTAAHTVVGAAR